ncbi:MAG TPA: efflux RND transporter periplasmic adaptor subunit [Bryobacteraceae bacterium]|jgi:HlyD family secretion protein
MKRYWLILLLPLLLLAWWGWGHTESAPVVHFASVQRTTIESTVSTNGKVEPAEWAAARAQAAGVVQSIAVQRGQQVTAGQTLVTLDSIAAQSAVSEALARQQEAQAENTVLGQGGKAATLASLNDSLRAAQSSVDVAQRNYDALQRMAGAQAATKLQVLEAKDILERAKLQVVTLQNQRKTLVTQSDRSVAEAKLQDAEAALSLARHRVALATIPAPLSGTLYQFDLKVGAYLEPGGLVGLVGNLDQVKVTVYVDEPDLGRVALGMPVNIGWDARPTLNWRGHVTKLPTEVTALGTRTVGEVSTVVDNPNHDLLPGVSVNAVIVSKVVKDAVSIPKAALRSLHGVNGVYKLAANALIWTPVTTGVSDVNNVQVLSGLNTGDQVADRVIEPSDAELRDGFRVKTVLN